MPFSLGDLLYGVVVPAVVAGIVLTVLWRLLPRDLGERYPAPAATLAGFLVGYGLLSLAPWTATIHWHWLVYTILAATIAGPVACAPGVKSFERCLLFALVAVVAGWLLVPMWDDLNPSRPVQLLLFTASVVVLASLLEPLVVRLPGPLLPVVLWATMTAAAVVLALSGSLRFAQIALAGAGACFGIVLARSLQRDAPALSGIGLAFSVTAVGCLTIGHVNSFSNVPFAVYLLVPFAPLLLWTTVAGPFSRLTGVKRLFVHAGLPLIFLAVLVAIAVVADLGVLRSVGWGAAPPESEKSVPHEVGLAPQPTTDIV